MRQSEDNLIWIDLEMTGLDPDGASRSLDSGSLSASLNDGDASFCEATTLMESLDYGSPGAPNAACP